MYTVIILHDSEEVLVVPSNWVSSEKTHCYWPPFKSTEKCMEAIQNKLNPETEGKPWEKLCIIFLGQYDKVEILQVLRDIKSKIQQNSTMLKKLLKDNTVSEAPSSTCVPSKNLNLPLRTLEDVSRTEMELNNATTRKKYVSRHSIYTMFKGILYTHLFNWLGRGDKKPFSKLILTDVIRDAALNRNVNRGDCETEMKKYLSYAAGRKKSKEQGGE
ncbi:hypothetical protein H4Q32_029649 [Labeo rohita]|uniref:Uncharacterized protein n=1 Tax=Labeo rohita TaxID=84645 RepID=A0ABQ8KZ94_LABRO|nr:hypothetical protein H4Q32_029649 [Labeo rohita]